MRGLGFIHDLLDHVEEDRLLRPLFDSIGAARLTGVTPSFATSRDWRHLNDKVLNQGGTSSCVPHFVNRGVFLAGQAQGTPVKAPAIRWSYDVARYRDSRGNLVDAGCRPRAMFEGLSDSGMIAEERYPFDPAKINEPPPFDLDVKAADAKLTGWYDIPEGAAAPDQLRAASDKGHFPGLAIDVYTSLDNLGPYDVYDQPAGDFRGSHMVTVVGYRPGQILILNSWGPDWADAGYGWISDRFVASHFTRYRGVITSVPTGLAA